MSMSKKYYVVHDSDGHILALAPVKIVEPNEDIHLSWQPFCDLKQFVTEVELTGDQAFLPLHELIKAFHVHIDSQTHVVTLQRHSESEK